MTDRAGGWLRVDRHGQRHPAGALIKTGISRGCGRACSLLLFKRHMSHQGSILIVDDEPDIGAMLTEDLIPRGYRVDVALHGGDAVMLASIERPDAVILDLMLPEISGEQIFQQLRELDPSIAIVLLTGMADESVARALLRAGAFDYLRKPPDFERLHGAVALAVAAGREKARPGSVVPLASDRRTFPASPAREAVAPESAQADRVRRPFRL